MTQPNLKHFFKNSYSTVSFYHTATEYRLFRGNNAVKKQYCIGIWNVRSMNQGKQKMARVNIDILGISELKWTGMGEFNSDDHYICYCGQESLRRN